MEQDIAMQNTLNLNTAKGSRVYNKFFLMFYDFFVIRIFSRFLWKCSKSYILSLYNQFLSRHHLEIGVGTGYYLDKAQFPNECPEISLIDLNTNCLAATAERIKRYQPKTFQRDIYSPLNLPNMIKFDSVGINYLLHCLPGTMATKIQALVNIKPYLNSNAVIFGTTILGENVNYNPVIKGYLKFLNRKGIFTNLADDLENLQNNLEKHFKDVTVKQIGNTAIFVAKN